MPVIQRLIPDEKTAFIKVRTILDSVVTAQEVIHWCHVKKEAGVVVFLDLEKAYDKALRGNI